MSDGKSSGSNDLDIWNDIFQEVRRLFLDTAPLIYYVEKHPAYAKYLRPVFDRIDKGLLNAFTSPITLHGHRLPPSGLLAEDRIWFPWRIRCHQE